MAHIHLNLSLFIEVKFTRHGIHNFNHTTIVSLGTFSSTPKEALSSSSSHSPFPLPLSPCQPLIRFVSSDWPTLDICYKWNHAIYVTWHLTLCKCF